MGVVRAMPSEYWGDFRTSDVWKTCETNEIDAVGFLALPVNRM